MCNLGLLSLTMTTNTIKTTTEGSQFISQRFDALKTVEQWIAAFPERYAKLPAKIAKAFAIRDMKNAR
jgi:hypothetical protein